MAAVELAIRQLDAPEVDGITYDEVIEAGEHLPGMAALWDEATVEERYEMVTIILEPGGLYYDLENKIIAAIKPRPAFLPVLRMLNGVMEFDETRGLLVTEHWCDRNRRESGSLQDTLLRMMCHYRPHAPRVAGRLSVFYLLVGNVSTSLAPMRRSWGESRESWQNQQIAFTGCVHLHRSTGMKKRSSLPLPSSRKRASCYSLLVIRQCSSSSPVLWNQHTGSLSALPGVV
jgi:hypothetical protein